jgi:hypothetical protein
LLRWREQGWFPRGWEKWRHDDDRGKICFNIIHQKSPGNSDSVLMLFICVVFEGAFSKSSVYESGGKPEGNQSREDLDEDKEGNFTRKIDLRYGGVVWTELIWLRIGNS